MKLRIFLVLAYLFTIVFSANSFARKPAVEDFVGVETENYKPTTKGTEVLFNFGNHITSHEKQMRDKQKTTGWLATGTLVAFILLPFFMWAGITSSFKKEDEVNEVSNTDSTVEPTVELKNVKHLSDYKTDHDDDDIKKAS